MEDKVHAAVPGLAQTRQESRTGEERAGRRPRRLPQAMHLPRCPAAHCLTWDCDREACCPGGKASLEMGRVYSSHTRLGNPVTSSCKPHCETVPPRSEGLVVEPEHKGLTLVGLLPVHLAGQHEAE